MLEENKMIFLQNKFFSGFGFERLEVQLFTSGRDEAMKL